jgi:DNA (cytosine-5)-methyltransferase 1
MVSHTLRAEGADASEDGTGRGTPLVPSFGFISTFSNQGIGDGVSPTLVSRQAAVAHCGVRRLTPREAERLQGMQDDFTLVPYRGGMAKDAPRYKSIGNSMAVNVLYWIGQRIQQAGEPACVPPPPG